MKVAWEQHVGLARVQGAADGSRARARAPDVQLKAVYQAWLARREDVSPGRSSRSEWKPHAAFASSPMLRTQGQSRKSSGWRGVPLVQGGGGLRPWRARVRRATERHFGGVGGGVSCAGKRRRGHAQGQDGWMAQRPAGAGAVPLSVRLPSRSDRNPPEVVPEAARHGADARVLLGRVAECAGHDGGRHGGAADLRAPKPPRHARALVRCQA
jgi:hypothetical protein